MGVSLAAVLGTGCASSGVHTATMPNPYGPPPRNAVTFWGHACAYIDIGGYGIVTDPVFSERYAVIRRRLIPAPPMSAYARTRIVLISHAHQDHTDPSTLRRFPHDARILAPAPAARYLRNRGFQVRTMIPGDVVPFPGGTIIAVAALHPGSRLSLKARADGRALGYVIRTSDRTLYYSGDTEYFPGLTDIGRRFRPDLVLLNVNPHLHSKDALAAIADVGAPKVVPMHWGAYDGRSVRLVPGWIHELVEALGDRVIHLPVGGTLALRDLEPATAR
jgi:L-ascorbate metabolism protein UlaG (beta-lactamase superfamily)